MLDHNTLIFQVLNTIKQYNLINDGDTIALALSGGKDSVCLLHILNRISSDELFQKKYKVSMNFKIKPFIINLGIAGQEKSINAANQLCDALGLELEVLNIKDYFSFTIPEIMKMIRKSYDNYLRKMRPCVICGILKRRIMNRYAKHIKASKLATGHHLDDELETIFMNIIKNNFFVNLRLGPMSGITRFRHFVPRIKPLYFVEESEVANYVNEHKLVHNPIVCSLREPGLRLRIRAFLNKLSLTKQQKINVINNFLEYKVKCSTKLRYKEHSELLNQCEICGEPISSNLGIGNRPNICKICEILNRLDAGH